MMSEESLVEVHVEVEDCHVMSRMTLAISRVCGGQGFAFTFPSHMLDYAASFVSAGESSRYTSAHLRWRFTASSRTHNRQTGGEAHDAAQAQSVSSHGRSARTRTSAPEAAPSFHEQANDLLQNSATIRSDSMSGIQLSTQAWAPWRNGRRNMETPDAACRSRLHTPHTHSLPSLMIAD